MQTFVRFSEIIGDRLDPPERAAALRLAHHLTARFVRRLPPGLDPEAFFGESRLAVLIAERTYRAGVGSFLGYVARRVAWALAEERRRQDHVGRARRAALQSGAVLESPADS